MPKKKVDLHGMLHVDSRQLVNVKGELLKLTKKKPWHNVVSTEERKKQKNKIIADFQTWHSVARREEPKKTEEQRNGRLVRQDVSCDLKE
ncbi:hypothetical protein AVEN_242759-1 [Araneus ventricosus]|uniref:Uncharacterized protein n=1 Tax=Araneus ventricosus TaxID=182803 RepID=A0A4Y2VAS3_ARAVE|nr:hypothetical protein AVEN_242759-1 [Araneus ventricosus]